MTTSRRSLIAGLGATAAAAALGSTARAQDATPGASPAASPADGPWSHTDVFGNTVELPARPVRIAANLMTAAALWDYGIRPVAVFDWTASQFPDGDHVGWGNVDPATVTNVGDADGNILPEDLKVVAPDIILTLSYDASDPDGSTAGVAPDYADAINTIAPVFVVTDQDATDIQLQRLIDLAVALGGDIESDEVLAAQQTYQQRVMEVAAIVQVKADQTALFANFDQAALWVAGPQGVADLQFLGSLGLKFANGESDAAGDFWEELSLEAVDRYPADMIFNDVYSLYGTLEELQGQAAFGTMPAIAAGQVGTWLRDFPVNYAGMVQFLDSILDVLRFSNKVT